MTDAPANFAGLQAMHREAVLLKEGGQPVALLPSFGFMAADIAYRMDLLLVPFAHSGYDTRLFFETRSKGAAPTGTRTAWSSATGGHRRGITCLPRCDGRKCCWRI
ncbi:hypothetical protein ACM43_12790 [Bradyrhizobium sp. CCBAU 45321]|uniref:hypothetical protein n=1 Tax=Bradyrhizobium sp. CCBAU 45321 TaxID=1641878 RepID=UPI002302069D|nr:hypothetical protein [Bradyrhizobium sp. CCBAU 45321]MDA9545305.1 hypothetical protein [Bradyrhizobium sp. CCBAU 45321]